jgi:hypothetical protein
LALGVGLVAQERTVMGTGRIDGQVQVMNDGGPVRRAIVTLSGDVLQSRSAISDDNGRFSFVDLPVGRVTLTATRPGFITSSYGAKAPGQIGTRLSLTAGQHVTDAVIRLARTAAITGTVRNEQGEPVPNARVTALPLRRLDARAAALVNVGLTPDPSTSAVTDDRGAYRLWGLTAGSYLVAASLQLLVSEAIERVTSAEMDARFAEAQRTLGRLGGASALASVEGRGRAPAPSPAADPRHGYSPIFYPGTPSAAHAQRIAVEFGDELTGIDIPFTITPAVRVEGQVLSAGGPWPRLQLTLTMDTPMALPFRVQWRPALTLDEAAPTATSTGFRFTGVTPGRYTVIARTAPGGATLWASVDVDVSTGDVAGVQLALRPPIRLTGQVRFEGAAPRPPDLRKAPVSLGRAMAEAGDVLGFNPAMFQALPSGSTVVEDDRSFSFQSVYPGLFRISAAVPGDATWRLRSAVLGGRELLDDLLVVTPDQREDITGVVLTFSDRRTAITGTLQTPAGAPAPEYFIVVFPTERRWWRPDGRRLAFARPATDGQFVLRDLPPGEYYIAALTDLDTATWHTPAFLDQVVPGALTLVLGENETRTQDLRIAYE